MKITKSFILLAFYFPQRLGRSLPLVLLQCMKMTRFSLIVCQDSCQSNKSYFEHQKLHFVQQNVVIIILCFKGKVKFRESSRQLSKVNVAANWMHIPLLDAGGWNQYGRLLSTTATSSFILPLNFVEGNQSHMMEEQFLQLR